MIIGTNVRVYVNRGSSLPGMEQWEEIFLMVPDPLISESSGSNYSSAKLALYHFGRNLTPEADTPLIVDPERG